MMLGLVVLLAFTGCEKFTCSDSHKVSELAGTWTCLHPEFAEAVDAIESINVSIVMKESK